MSSGLKLEQLGEIEGGAGSVTVSVVTIADGRMFVQLYIHDPSDRRKSGGSLLLEMSKLHEFGALLVEAEKRLRSPR